MHYEIKAHPSPDIRPYLKGSSNFEQEILSDRHYPRFFPHRLSFRINALNTELFIQDFARVYISVGPTVALLFVELALRCLVEHPYLHLEFAPFDLQFHNLQIYRFLDHADRHVLLVRTPLVVFYIVSLKPFLYTFQGYIFRLSKQLRVEKLFVSLQKQA